MLSDTGERAWAGEAGIGGPGSSGAYMPGITIGHRYAARALRAVVVGVLLVAAGYALHGQPSTVTVRMGTPYSRAGQIAITTSGWIYNVPLTVRWLDGTGNWHEGDRPVCLPPTGTLPTVQFGTVSWTRAGTGVRTVVWINCAQH